MEQDQEKAQPALAMVEEAEKAKVEEALAQKALEKKQVERKGIVKMNKIEGAIGKLPINAVCFLLEIGTGKLEVTKAIGEVLKKKRPMSIVMSINDYNADDDIVDYQYTVKHMDLDDNVMLFDIPKESFLNTNQTKFNIIFAHNSIDAVPFKKFLTDNGQVVIVSKMELK